MPKTLTPAMRAHLDAETTQLAAIWRITRKDGTQFFFTDHDRDIVFGGDTYRADAGFERTAIRSDAGFAVDNLDLVGVFAEGGIVEDEVRAGLLDGAEIRVSFVNWENPDTYGEIRLRRGTLGEVRLTPQGHFTAELRGLSQPLAQSTLQIYGPACRTDLGDARCRFPIKPPVLGREQAVQPGAFYGVATGMGAGFQVYDDRIYEVTAAGTTDAVAPTYDTTIGNPTTDGTALLTARDSFMRVATVETVTSNRVFTANDVLAPYEDHWFASGALTFETGANAGRTIEIKGWTQATRTLELWAPAKRRRPGRGPVSPLRRVQQAHRRGLPRQVPDPRQPPVRPRQRQEFSGRALRAGWRPGGAGAMTTTLATAGTLGLTAAGGYLFGPLGAGAGALVGSFLFGGSGQKVEGPRLGDLSVAASSYGGVIPVAFETQKVAGTIIWATDIRETKHTDTKGGGLFGGGTKVVEYRYFANFAVALGEGPAGAVTRIWAGDKLIARLRSSDHARANHPKYRFRIYLGTEDQQPDPLIRKHVPANATPAHRGLVYMVFEDLPLDEFGNRVPPITAEVAWAGAANPVANSAAINSAYQPDHFSIDPAHNRGFVRTASTGNLVRSGSYGGCSADVRTGRRALVGLPGAKGERRRRKRRPRKVNVGVKMLWRQRPEPGAKAAAPGAVAAG